MRGDTVFRVYGVHEGREKDVYFGAFRTREEAEAHARELATRDEQSQSWAQRYHNKGFQIRAALVETDFEIPPLPKPRDKYAVKTSRKPNRPGTWDSTIVEVLRRNAATDNLDPVCSYERNYGMLRTFEPFRQGIRELALISRSYTKTAVLDLATGGVIAEEKEEYYDEGQSAPGAGFCPVGFYVPDWWDVNDASIIPGSEYWDADKEWPNGDFGFVWGCYWGDDSSWKVHYLDLSRVQEGIVRRDDRFGYVELATEGYEWPCGNLSPSKPGVRSKPPTFINVQRDDGLMEVTFAVEMRFNLSTGVSNDWQRKRAPHDDPEDGGS